jgi:hypothetical protein
VELRADFSVFTLRICELIVLIKGKKALIIVAWPGYIYLLLLFW